MSSSLTPRPPPKKKGARPPSEEYQTAVVVQSSGSKKGPRPPSKEFEAIPVSMPSKPKTKNLKEQKVRGKRASDMLRRRGSHVEVEAFFHDEEYKELEEEHPSGWKEKLVLAYKKKIHEKKFCNRALVCALAVSMLWASSLAVCRLLVNTFVPQPTYTDIENSVLNLELVVDAQSDGYKQCVDTKFNTCHDDYVIKRDFEIQRVYDEQDVNFALLDAYSDIKDSCATDHDRIIEALNVMRNSNNNGHGALSLPDFFLSPTEYENGVQVPVDCAVVDQLSRQQLVARQAISIGEDTADASNSAVDNFTSQLDARIAYDLDYFGISLPSYWETEANIFNENMFDSDAFFASMNTSMADLQRCLLGKNVNGSATCPNGTAVAASIDSIYSSFNADYQNVQSQAQIYVDNFNDIVADAQALQAAADRIGQISGIDFHGLPPPWTLPNVNLGGINGNFFDPDFLASLGIDPNTVAALQQQATDQFLGQVVGSAEDLENLKQNCQLLENQFSDGLLSDYDPPPVDYNETNADHKKNAANLADAMAADLSYVRNTTADTTRLERIISSANQTAANLLVDATNRDFSLFGYPDFVFKEFKIGLAQFSNYAVLFDTVWRVMHSVLLIRKYWSISGINTPPADVRADAGALYKDKKSIPQMIAAVLTHPLLQLFNTAFWITLLTFAIYLAYEPLYTEYVEGCVLHTFQQIPSQNDGTMIYRNLLTVTTNKAVSAGDKAVTSNIDALNLERQLACQDYFDSSALQRIQQNESFVNMNDDMKVLAERFTIYGECVDWSTIDTSFDTIHLPNVGFNFDDLVNQPECKETFQPINLSDALLFNCEKLPACSSSGCSLSAGTLELQNHITACTCEYGLHAYFLSGLFAGAMYICLNISRFYFMRAVIAIWWNQITLDLYSYLGSCTEKGTILPPKEVKAGRGFQDVIHEKLGVALRKFSRNGYFEMFYALFINIPWIVFITILSKNLKYENSDSNA